MLRPTQNVAQYEVVGGCPYVHGLMDAEALLGPLPAGWSFQARMDSRGLDIAGYLNADTENWVSAENDPRLGPPPDDWEFVPRSHWHTRTHEAAKYQEWRNTVTGRIVTSDPRLLPNTLEQRGVELVNFDLV